MITKLLHILSLLFLTISFTAAYAEDCFKNKDISDCRSKEVHSDANSQPLFADNYSNGHLTTKDDKQEISEWQAGNSTDDSYDGFFTEIYEHYGPKNAQPKADSDYFQSLTKDELKNIWLRWYGLDEEYKDNYKHWHQGDHDINFDNFTSKVKFIPLSKNYLNVKGVCKHHYEYPTSVFGKALKKFNIYKGIKKYTDIRFYSGDDQWFDINQHRDKHYSLTFWDWINTIAIKTKNHTYISHSKPWFYRWNEDVPNNVVEEIFKEGQFELFIELNMLRVNGELMTESEKLEFKVPPKFNLTGVVKVDNVEELRACFE